MRFTKPGPDPTPLPREPRLKTPVPASALQHYTEAADLELGTAIAMLNSDLDNSVKTALQQLNLQRPNSNIKAQLAQAGINAGLIEKYSNSLQETATLHCQEHFTIHNRGQCKVLQDEIQAR